MNTHLRVAVCTNREPAAVAEALAALQREVPEDRLALVLSGGRGGGYEAPLVLSEPLPGLSRARNRALEWAGGSDALAFVDDDAVVEPGWYEGLLRRWAEAPPEAPCIGGPIRPRYAVPPPAWFSDGIAHVLTLLDRGPSVRDLDPSVEAVYGANISFRAE